MLDARFQALGDRAVLVELGSEISPRCNRGIRLFLQAIEAHTPKGFVEAIPTYTSLTVCYDPLQQDFDGMVAELTEILSTVKESASGGKVRLVCLPTVYGGDFGPDLPFVASHAGLSEKEVIDRHSGRDYLVYMLGFLPGFAYLGGMDEALTTPRLQKPRTKIAAGSVGIAASQTGTYPCESPGGWQLIGRTAVPLYSADTGALLQVGDYVRYVPIDPSQWPTEGDVVPTAHIELLDESELHVKGGE